MRSSCVLALERAMRFTITSESIVVWKMEPSASRRLRMAKAFVKLPLWATAI